VLFTECIAKKPRLKAQDVLWHRASKSGPVRRGRRAWCWKAAVKALGHLEKMGVSQYLPCGTSELGRARGTLPKNALKKSSTTQSEREKEKRKSQVAQRLKKWVKKAEHKT